MLQVMGEVRFGTCNIYKGGRHTYSALKQFVKEEDLDVFSIQEANDWQRWKFEDFIGVEGLKYAVFGNSNTPFNLVTYSRRPIRGSRTHTSVFCHGAIESILQIHGRQLRHWNTHLDPLDADNRLLEAAYIVRHSIKHMRPNTSRPHDTLITGDLNTPADDGYMDKLYRGLPPDRVGRYFDSQGNLRNEAIDHLKNHGFIDAAEQVGTRESTFPARTDTEPNPQTMRLDRTFVSQDLAESVLKVEVVKNDLTAGMSDHYPKITTMNIAAPLPIPTPRLPISALQSA